MPAVKPKTRDSTPPANTGRRQRKKDLTRRALTDAALTLFQHKGFEAVTVAEISDAVDVDPSTFFRYFGSKEAVLRSEGEEMAGFFNSRLAERPGRESLRASLLAVLAETFNKYHVESNLHNVRLQLAANSPTVQALADAITQEFQVEVAEAIAQRLECFRETDPRPDIISSAFIACANSTDRLRLDSGKVDIAQLHQWMEDGLVSAQFFFRE